MEEFEALKQRADGVGAVKYSAAKSCNTGATHSSVESMAILLDMAHERFADAVNKECGLMKEVMQLIDLAPMSIGRVVLSRRYLLGQSITELAEELDISISYAHRARNKAMKELAAILEKQTAA
ncbi:hypothetical protein [Phascolarctobacterium sp.]|uniref:hypothetical protein n=1 Tax=Phascolarctobacterium sp. TaxID=2049039 RepID=UPI0026DBE236|nr:hypothetical protein [Phascolarctobacterium sp.]